MAPSHHPNQRKHLLCFCRLNTSLNESGGRLVTSTKNQNKASSQACAEGSKRSSTRSSKDGGPRLSGELVFPWGRLSIEETFKGRPEAYLTWLGRQEAAKAQKYLKRLLGERRHRPRSSYPLESQTQYANRKRRAMWT